MPPALRAYSPNGMHKLVYCACCAGQVNLSRSKLVSVCTTTRFESVPGAYDARVIDITRQHTGDDVSRVHLHKKCEEELKFKLKAQQDAKRDAQTRSQALATAHVPSPQHRPVPDAAEKAARLAAEAVAAAAGAWGPGEQGRAVRVEDEGGIPSNMLANACPAYTSVPCNNWLRTRAGSVKSASGSSTGRRVLGDITNIVAWVPAPPPLPEANTSPGKQDSASPGG